MSISVPKAAKKTSTHQEIVIFKLNCFLARKFYIGHQFSLSKHLYDQANASYPSILDKIYNFPMKLELQQFYINMLFQYSNVFAKLGETEKSVSYCRKTTELINGIGVNRIALAQEAQLQELMFKNRQRKICPKPRTPEVQKNPKSASPIEMEMALIKNMKMGSEKSMSRGRKTKKDEPKPSVEETPKSHRRKTQAKSAAKMKTPMIRVDSPTVSKREEENSPDLVNVVKEVKQQKEEPKKRIVRKIPVRTGGGKVEKVTKEPELVTTEAASSKTATSTRKKNKSEIPELAVHTRKISRRMI